MATETKTFYPSGYENSTFSSVSNASNAIGQGSNGTAQVTLKSTTGSYNWLYVYWLFGVSGIPEDAIVDSVVCKVKIRVGNTGAAQYSDSALQLFAGSTAKGSAVVFTNTSAQVITLAAGTWTIAELLICRLRIGLKRGSDDSVQSNVFFYGADLAVQYTFNNEKFMLKLGGAWHDSSRVFKKVSGIWVEQTDLANVIEDGVRYQNGGEYIAPVKPAAVTITGTGNATYCYATINGTKYSSAASNIEVMPGDTITFCVYGRSSSYYGRVTIDGVQALNVTNQTTQTYNWTVPDGVKTISIAMTYTSSSTQRNGRITVTTTR